MIGRRSRSAENELTSPGCGRRAQVCDDRYVFRNDAASDRQGLAKLLEVTKRPQFGTLRFRERCDGLGGRSNSFDLRKEPGKFGGQPLSSRAKSIG